MCPSRLKLLMLSLLAAASLVSGIRAQAPTIVTVADSACSVGLFARQQGAGGTIWTTSLEDTAGSGRTAEAKSGVHVSVTARKPAERLREITLRVTYLPRGLRAVPMDNVAPVAGLKEATQTFHLSAGDGGSVRVAGDLLLGRVSGVRKVSIEQIEFADGKVWTAPASNPCSVAPSGFMLVGSR